MDPMGSFIAPDLLLQIVRFVLIDAHTAGERWRRLLSIMLVDKLAYSTLVGEASFWRWVDADHLGHAALFCQRAAGLHARPVVTYAAKNDFDGSRIESLTAMFQHASPTLHPEALFVELKRRGRTPFVLLLSKPGVWTNLRVLALNKRGDPDWVVHLDEISLTSFPRLESLAVTDCVPLFESGDNEPTAMTSLVSLFIGNSSLFDMVMDQWIKSFDRFPNLRNLSLSGFAGRFGSDPIIALPALRTLRLLPYYENGPVNRLRLDTPMLESVVFFAPRARGILLNKVLRPESIQRMVRFYTTPLRPTIFYHFHNHLTTMILGLSLHQVDGWPVLKQLSLVGSFNPQAGWPQHISALAGHLPRSLEVVRVMWDVPEYSFDNPTPIGIFESTIARARDAAVSCLRAYRTQYGVPLRRWEYAIASGLCHPPNLRPKQELKANEVTVAGSVYESDFDILMDYKHIEDHVYGESTRPEDNLWEQSGCAVSC